MAERTPSGWGKPSHGPYTFYYTLPFKDNKNKMAARCEPVDAKRMVASLDRISGTPLPPSKLDLKPALPSAIFSVLRRLRSSPPHAPPLPLAASIYCPRLVIGPDCSV